MSETPVVFEQPKTSNVSTNVHPLIMLLNINLLAPFESVTSLTIRHDRSAECFSSTSRYELIDPSNQTRFTGTYSQRKDYFWSQRSPFLLLDAQNRRPVMQIVFENADDCFTCGGEINVTIDSPPGGKTIGEICIKRDFLTRTEHTIENSLNGQRLNVRREGNFLTGLDYYLNTDNDSKTVGTVKKKGNFSVDILNEMDPTMKANIIGYAIVLDILHEENRRGVLD